MTYSIGGLPVEIDFKFEYGKKRCEKFLCDLSPLLHFEASMEEIKKESESSLWHDDRISEFECIFRKIYNAFPPLGRIVMHGASIMMDGKGYLFTAPSGTGKSTHIRLWGKTFKDKVTVVDGDKPFVGFVDGVPMVFGSPRSGKENWSNPISAPLCGIAFLERAEMNSILRVTPKEIVDKAFMQFYIPKNKELAIKTFEIINKLLETVPLYILKCNMEKDAAIVAYDGMSKN